MIPIGMSRGSGVGSDHQQAIAVGDIHHWCCTWLAAFCACRSEQQQWPAGEGVIRLAAVRAEILNQLAVVIVLVWHTLSSYGCRIVSAVCSPCVACAVQCYTSTFVRYRLPDFW